MEPVVRKSLNADFGLYLILKSRFEDTKDKRVLFKRKEDFLKDLNLNLFTGKITKSTNYIDENGRETLGRLVSALEKESGEREPELCNLIEPFVRSISIFKPYREFESSDFQSVLQEMKLHKVRKGTRICNFGDNADTVYLILAGRVAITHPKAALMKLKEGSPKELRERTEILTQRQTVKRNRLKTFITAQG